MYQFFLYYSHEFPYRKTCQKTKTGKSCHMTRMAPRKFLMPTSFYYISIQLPVVLNDHLFFIPYTSADVQWYEFIHSKQVHTLYVYTRNKTCKRITKKWANIINETKSETLFLFIFNDFCFPHKTTFINPTVQRV